MDLDVFAAVRFPIFATVNRDAGEGVAVVGVGFAKTDILPANWNLDTGCVYIRGSGGRRCPEHGYAAEVLVGIVPAIGGSMEAGYEFADGFEGGLAVDFEVFEDDGSGGVCVGLVPLGLAVGLGTKEGGFGHCHGEGVFIGE